MEIVKHNYIRESNDNSGWRVIIDPLPQSHLTYHKESLLAAEEIFSLKDGQLYLMYSGGLDSEYVLSVFLDLKIDIVPVIIRLSPGYNDHDVEYAFKYCQNKKLNPLIVDIDFDHFVKTGQILDTALSMRSCVYHYSVTADVISRLNGTVLMGDGEPYIQFNSETKTWNVVRYQYDFSMINFYRKFNIRGTPDFLVYRPEMMISFLKTPRVRELAENKHPGKLGSNSSKYIIYSTDNDYNLLPRPKYTGYEKIESSLIFQDPIFKEFDRLKNIWGGIDYTDYYKFLNNICKQ